MFLIIIKDSNYPHKCKQTKVIIQNDVHLQYINLSNSDASQDVKDWGQLWEPAIWNRDFHLTNVEMGKCFKRECNILTGGIQNICCFYHDWSMLK